MNEHCLLFSSEQRLSDCLNNWVKTKQSYFDPDSFRLNLNNCIQSLRNVTFILQSNKANFTNFDDWYKIWQDKMRKDPILKWLVEARNHIVKNGDLITKSMVRFTVVESWFDSPLFEVEAPLFTKLNESYTILTQKAPENIDLTIGLLKIERRWVDSKLPDNELLEALSYAFLFFAELLSDAHQKLLNDEPALYCSWYSNNISGKSIIIPCMLAQEWDRTLWIDLRSRTLLSPSITDIHHTEEDYIKAEQKYSLKDMPKLSMDTFNEEAKACFELAKKLLNTDGNLVPVAFIGYPNGQKKIQALYYKDRAQKHIIFRQLAADIEKTGAISIIAISEVWISQLENAKLTQYELEAPDRKEALQLIAANSNNDKFSYTVLFEREKNGEIRFGKEQVCVEDELNILEPILTVWKKKMD